MSSAADTEVATAADPTVALETLAASRDPYFIGVRHHSPALAAAVPALLDEFRPEVLLIELPAEAAPWLGHLADPETYAPIALAGAAGEGGEVAFYPFADFSPELAAVRWAQAHGVPVLPCDAPLGLITGSLPGGTAASAEPAEPAGLAESDAPKPGYHEALRTVRSGRASDDLWDRQVEARAPGSSPEQVRRAALAVGWALREDAPRVTPRDLAREAWMRAVLRSVEGRRAAMLLGAFHIPAMIAESAKADEAAAAAEYSDELVATTTKDVAAGAMSLVPYTFKLLDERSGYPSGIRDPAWQQSVFEAAGDPGRVHAAAASHLVEFCRALRAGGHPAGPGEAQQALRFALDLASLRGLAAPARGEIVEAAQAVLGHGDSLGRGQALAKALETALVGDRHGQLAQGTPSSGLRASVEALLRELRLPGPRQAGRELRLDPLRSPLDRRREIALRRLAACQVPYAQQRELVAPGGLPALTTAWQAQWTPSVEAQLNILTARGLTLAQAAENTLRLALRAQREAGGPSVGETLTGLLAAAECGVPAVVAERVHDLIHVVIPTASLAELISAAQLADRISTGHVPGTPVATGSGGDAAEKSGPIPADIGELIDAAALRHLDGMHGSQDLADAKALTAFTLRGVESGSALRAVRALRRLEHEGAPMISGAAGACLVLAGAAAPEALGVRLVGWIDTATHRSARSALRERLRGLLAAAEPLLDLGPALLEPLVARVNSLPDKEFLDRLPALRGGFSRVDESGRDRVLRAVEELLGGTADLSGGGAMAGEVTPEDLADAAAADLAGRNALLASGIPFAQAVAATGASTTPDVAVAVAVAVQRAAQSARIESVQLESSQSSAPVLLSPGDRWRLVLARRENECSGAARRYGIALDELYGHGGSGRSGRGGGSASSGGGREAAFPNVREWAKELEALFGKGIREEVLSAAVASGHLDAALLLDPATVTPSVELLRNVLSMAGNLPENSVARLRPLVKRLVDELTRQLANRLRPALHGLTSPRPSSRPSNRLDFDRTVRANLATARREPDGRVTLLPERPVFRSRVRKSAEWDLILVVDVSGSMESSVIWSALTASVFAGISTLRTHFLAFSTEVVDFTDRVSDPLSLLLEVRVGGGTHIAAGLAHARSLMTVPSRTLIVTISDFEEGYPVGGLLAEVRKLAESGATLLGCASLDDEGAPRYSVPIAQAVVAAGMPVAALSPLELAAWVGEKIR
jgi:Mg-chelatase subunit ChlD